MKKKAKKIIKSSSILAIISGIIGFGLFNYYYSYGTLNTMNGANVDNISVHVKITKDYGKTLLKEADVLIITGSSAKDALNQIANVLYEYGGGFIVNIDGLKSEFPDKYLDWFFFANGFMSNVGILDYALQGGDRISFNYHDWNYNDLFWSCYFDNSINTIKQGFGGSTSNTIISYENTTYMSIAFDIKDYLMSNGISNITIKEDDFISSTNLGENNVLLIGGYSMSQMEDFYTKTSTAGFFSYFKSNSEIERIKNGDGTPPNEFNVVATYTSGDNVSLINIAQNPFPPNVLGTPTGRSCIAFSGLDKDSIIDGVQKFIDNNITFNSSYGVLILNGVPQALPF